MHTHSMPFIQLYEKQMKKSASKLFGNIQDHTVILLLTKDKYLKELLFFFKNIK